MKKIKIAFITIICASLLTACNDSKPDIKDVYGKTWIPDISHELNTLEKTLDPQTLAEFKEKVSENPEKMGIKIEEKAFIDLSNSRESRQGNEGWSVVEKDSNLVISPIFNGKPDENLKMNYDGKSLCLIQERKIKEVICFKEL